MNNYTLSALFCFLLLAPALYAQTKTSADATKVVTSPPLVPEEARKHFVMGTTLFKDAKTADDFVQVEGEFKQATDLAPQWPDARYNLALAKEAAGDYSGAMEDLKLYQKFKLSESEARTVQDKIYALEAKAVSNSPDTKLRKFLRGLDGTKWRHDVNENGQVWYSEITCSGNSLARKDFIISSRGTNLAGKTYDAWKATFDNNKFIFSSEGDHFYHGQGVISNDAETISIHSVVTNNAAFGDFTWVYTRE
jgi:hypothetical protein